MKPSEIGYPSETVVPHLKVRERCASIAAGVAAGVEKVADAAESQTLRKMAKPIGRVSEAAALALVPGGQVVAAERVVKEIAKTAAKEAVNATVREIGNKLAEETDCKYVGAAIRESVSLMQGAHGGACGDIKTPVGFDPTSEFHADTADKNVDEDTNSIPETSGRLKTEDVKTSEKSLESIDERIDRISSGSGCVAELLDQIKSAEGNLTRLDDNGLLIKDADGKLLPNIEYEINGNKYRTDGQGRIREWDAELRDTPDNQRDEVAQREVGGGGDNHGGHLVARINGGSSGSENMVSMRGTVNSGDYLRVEKQENHWLKDGHEVREIGALEYIDDETTPSRIEKCVYLDGVERIDQKIDNVEGSTALLSEIESELPNEHKGVMRELVSDMNDDGCTVSITSYTKEFDESGVLKSIRIDYRNESAEPKPIKDHLVFEVNNAQ